MFVVAIHEDDLHATDDPYDIVPTLGVAETPRQTYDRAVKKNSDSETK